MEIAAGQREGFQSVDAHVMVCVIGCIAAALRTEEAA